MDKDIKKMRKMVDFMRKQGVLTLKTPEMELNLIREAIHLEVEPLETSPQEKEERPMSDIDIALYSAPGWVPMQ
jgi:hypothetical protein